MTARESERPLLVVTEGALRLRRRLEPTAWIVLEELVLQAEHTDGHTVVAADVASICWAVGRSKDAVSRALRALEADGLISREELRDGVSGRFAGIRWLVNLPASGLRLPTSGVVAVPTDPRVTPTPTRRLRQAPALPLTYEQTP
jgi:hypothetical protein